MSIDHFTNDHYQRHNRRRLEHLATLGLPITGSTVLEIGAGPGDHTDFFLDRGCSVTSTDARSDLLDILARRHPGATTIVYDANDCPPADLGVHDIVYAYGILYHLSDPAMALKYWSNLAGKMLLLETCVSRGEELSFNPVEEDAGDATQAINGKGCRPTRRWVWQELQTLFEYVYSTATQPWHDEFILDWTDDGAAVPSLTRCVFIASHHPLDLPALVPWLPATQKR